MENLLLDKITGLRTNDDDEIDYLMHASSVVDTLCCAAPHKIGATCSRHARCCDVQLPSIAASSPKLVD